MALPEGKYGRLTGREASKLGYLPARVLLDGVEITEVVTVDDVEGWIDVIVFDEKGDHVLLLNDAGEVLGVQTRRMHGIVVYLPNGK